jgi:hypothetical protein
MILILAPTLALAAAADDKEPAKKADPKPADAGALVVLDAAGKEQKLKTWKFSAGTRRLGWLAPHQAEEKPDPKKPPRKDGEEDRPEKVPAGPEALEVRPETEIKFADGVLVLVPLDRLSAVDFDSDAETMTVKAVTVDGKEETLTGTTKYKRINKVSLEAEVDKGDLGIAEVRYSGGVAKGIRGLRFPAPKAPPAGVAGGRPAVVTSIDGEQKATHKVVDLRPLYHFTDGGEKLLPIVAFRKTLKIDIDKIVKLTAAEGERDESSWRVQLKDGSDDTLTLLPELEINSRKGRLEGFVGRHAAGFAFFPASAIAEVAFDPPAAGDK